LGLGYFKKQNISMIVKLENLVIKFTDIESIKRIVLPNLKISKNLARYRSKNYFIWIIKIIT